MDMGLIDVNNFLVLPLPMHFLGQTSLFSNSMICLLLSRPSILLNDSHLSQFLKLVDTNGTFTHVATFDTFHSQAEFEGIMKVSSKFSKLKNLMCENSTKQKHLHIQFHEDRRQFLIERISYVCMLCQDQPTLIPMNLFPLLTLLQLSRDEIVWYMMHPEDDRKSSQKAFHKSNEVLALIHWVLETKQVLLNYSDQVTSVILQRIKSEWAQTFQQAYTALIALPDLPPAVSEILNDMHQIYRDLSPATIASLERLRMNWARLQVYFSLPGAVLSISSMPHITSTLNTLSVMSTYIDRYTSYIDQVTDLSLLLTYKEVWYSMVMDTLRQSQGIPYLRYVPKLLMSFSTLPFHYLQPSSNFKHPLVFDLIDHFFNALAQVSMQYTFYSVQVKIEMDHAQFSAFEGSFSEVFAKEKKKGLGQYYSNKVLQDLKFLRQRISECLSIFQAYPIITTPSFNFIPSQYLEEHLTHSYQAFLQSFIYDHHLMNSKDAPIVEDASYVILKPSLILRDLQLLLEECLRMTWGLPEVSF
ncbi:Nck-associated protein 1-like, partial [Coelomomyces lativittatus]